MQRIIVLPIAIYFYKHIALLETVLGGIELVKRFIKL